MAVSTQQQLRLVGAQYADGKIDHDEARHRLVSLIREHFQCSRVSYWHLKGEPGERFLECVGTCGVETASHGVGKRFFEVAAPDYMEALTRRRMVVCEDTLADPTLATAKDRFMQPGASRALLDAALSANGKMIGVLCCEQVGETRRWSRPEVTAAMKFATAISMYIARLNVQTARAEATAAAAAALA